jgi:hypothetical protein
MIRPRAFGPNAQTAASNAFQQRVEGPLNAVREQALREFDALANALRDHGVTPLVFEDTAEPSKPDAVFPNNWVSFHADGRVFLYPLEAPVRRAERRMDIVESLSAEHGFRVRDISDLSELENVGAFLEGTGSMVLDRINRVAYAALSSRTHLEALADFAQRADYEITAFDACDADGQPIYHTNVMMAIGTQFAVVCSESIGDEDKRADVLGRLAATGRAVIEIDLAQMHRFAGNLIELRTADGKFIVVLSQNAYDSLTAAQRERLSTFGRLLPVDVATIECVGGGSVRCMLAEVFLPHADGSDHE